MVSPFDGDYRRHVGRCPGYSRRGGLARRKTDQRLSCFGGRTTICSTFTSMGCVTA